MNKIFTMVAMTLTITYNAIAQTVTGHFNLGNPEKVALSMPKEFAFDNTPLIFLYDNTNSSYDNTKENNLLIYDENLNLKKTIHLQGDKTFDYQLTYQDMTRDVMSVDEVGKYSYCEYGSYEEFIQHETGMDPNIQPIITEKGNGEQIITFDYSHNGWTSNEQMYYAYSHFGMRYPKVYFIQSNGIITGYRTNYTVTYSDWKNAGTHVENKQVTLGRLPLCNINLNPNRSLGQ